MCEGKNSFIWIGWSDGRLWSTFNLGGRRTCPPKVMLRYWHLTYKLQTSLFTDAIDVCSAQGCWRGNFNPRVHSLSLWHWKVPLRNAFLPSHVSPPPSPRLIASASLTASFSQAHLSNFSSKLEQTDLISLSLSLTGKIEFSPYVKVLNAEIRIDSF